MTSIAAGLERVRERLVRAAESSGRSPREVRLVAVSKMKPPDAIREAYAAGQRDFGENYVQELLEKAELLLDLVDIRWHLVGHLQRNKAKNAVRVVSVIHSVDSARLARELGKRSAEAPVLKDRWFGMDARLPVLVEVNVGGEAQKSGCAPLDLGAVLETIEQEPALRLIGLTTIPPHTEDPAGARPYFEELAGLRDRNGGSARLPELSMGMTHDLEHAVAAGATLLRVGTAIFGARS